MLIGYVKKCGFKYGMAISDRSAGHGCARCSNQYVDDTNSLLTKNPELCEEWDYKLNEFGPDKFAPNSGKIANWICKLCSNKWKAVIRDRNRGNSCPKCFGKYSKKCDDWINSLNNPNIKKGVKIKISGFKRKLEVDGFDYSTNTIYEFYGDLWHGKFVIILKNIE